MKSITGKLILASLLVFFTQFLRAQCPVAAPTPYCIEVDPATGDVTVTYDPSTGNNYLPGPPAVEGFDYYELQHSLASTGPFDSVAFAGSINDFSMVHTGVKHDAVHYYRIISHSLCETAPGVFTPQETAPSVVFNTIKINTVVSQDTVITLTWNQNGLGDPGATSGGYDLFRSYPVASPLNLRSPGIPYGSETYTDYLHECDIEIGYQVRLENPAGNCYSVSSVDTVPIKDLTSPPLQLVDSVSFNHFFNQPVIGWSASPHKDVVAYVIVVCSPLGGYNRLDTVASGVRTYRDTDYVNTGSVQYSVYAVDACGNVSTDFFTDCHNTIFLTYEVDVCEETVELFWNPYDDFNSGVSVTYQVYVSLGGAPAKLIGTTTDTRFLDEDPPTDTKVRYFVRAVENGGAGPFSASSNYVELETVFLKAPDFTYLRQVTVLDENEILTQMYVDTKSDIKEYRIKRSTDTIIDNFVTIGTIRLPSVPVPADSMVVFRDRTAATDIIPYYYLYESLDSCGRILDTSNFASSIRLKVTPNLSSKTNRLEWNNYIGWVGSVFGYRVYRGQDGVINPDPVVTVFPESGGTTFYEDDVSELTEGAKGNFCYYVEAIEDEPTFSRLQPATSRSNIACANHQPIVYIPNAFTPTGQNPLFKPVFIFTDVTDYEMIIFSRSGEKVFETNNLDAGWDGKVDGDMAQTGVYVYLIRYKAVTGQRLEERGTMTLVR